MARVLSIEVGYSLIKILETDFRSKNPKVYTCINLKTPANILQDGELTVTDDLVLLMRNALAEHHIKTKQAVFTVMSTRVASREVLLPNVKDNKLDSIIRANASDYFPVDVSEYELSYMPLGVVDEGTNKEQRRVQVLAVPKNILLGYEQLAAQCGLSLQAMDYVCNSIYQVIKNECNTGVQMVIKVDERMSIVTILEDGIIALQRSISYGVDDAIAAMLQSDAFEVGDYQEALELLRRRTCINRSIADSDLVADDSDKSDDESEQVRQARVQITVAFEDLIRGIARVIDYYHSRSQGRGIDNAFLTGLGGDFSGLSKLLTNELGFKVVVLNRVEGFSIEKQFREASFGEYIACLGAAVSPLGLMYEQQKDKGLKTGFDLNLPTTVCVFLLCLIIAVVILVVSIIPYKDAQRTNQEYRRKVENLSESIPAYLEYNETLTAYTYLQDAYDSTQLVTAGLVDFIEEMEEKMPHSFYIDAFTASTTGFSMNVTVATKQEAADCIEQFRTFDSVATISVNGINDSRNLLAGETDDGTAATAYVEAETETDEETGEEVEEEAAEEVVEETADSDEYTMQTVYSGTVDTDNGSVTFSISGTFAERVAEDEEEEAE